jgi:streptomycin 6-kinase
MINKLPPDFVHTVSSTFAGGASWLASLPALLDEAAARWQLQIGPHFPNLSYNYVAPAVGADGRPLVLKLGVPNPELESEIAALAHWGGRVTVELVAAAAARGMLLQERLQPGEMLHTLPDDEALRVTTTLMRELWQPPPENHSFRHVADWHRGLAQLRAHFGGGTGPFDPQLVAMAEGYAAELLDSMAAPVLLHGDLHQYNILSGKRRPWLIIDPKGVIGEPAYEIGAFMRNCLPQNGSPTEIAGMQSRRLAIFAEMLGFDRERLRMWCLAQQVLSAWWLYEDTGTGLCKCDGAGKDFRVHRKRLTIYYKLKSFHAVEKIDPEERSQPSDRHHEQGQPTGEAGGEKAFRRHEHVAGAQPGADRQLHKQRLADKQHQQGHHHQKTTLTPILQAPQTDYQHHHQRPKSHIQVGHDPPPGCSSFTGRCSLNDGRPA